MTAIQIIITVVVLIAIIGPLLTLYSSRKVNDLESVKHHTYDDDEDDDDDWGK